MSPGVLPSGESGFPVGMSFPQTVGIQLQVHSLAQDGVLLSRQSLSCLFPPSTSYIFIHIKFTHVICVIEISPGGPHQMGVRPLCRAPQSLVQQSCDDQVATAGSPEHSLGPLGSHYFSASLNTGEPTVEKKQLIKMHKKRYFYYQKENVSQRNFLKISFCHYQ